MNICSVLTNTDRSSLHRSVQQGCPLSPLQYRHHKNITGLEVGGSEALISLYADDVILYLNSGNSVPVLLELITSFGRLSGHTIILSESSFTPLSDTYTPGFLENIPFKIVRDHFVYLGLTIPKDPKLLYKLNFAELLSKLKRYHKELENLAFIGRINSLKVVSLPRFLYISQNIQIFLTLAFFKGTGFYNFVLCLEL